MRFEEGLNDSAFSLAPSFDASKRPGCRRHGTKRFEPGHTDVGVFCVWWNKVDRHDMFPFDQPEGQDG